MKTDKNTDKNHGWNRAKQKLRRMLRPVVKAGAGVALASGTLVGGGAFADAKTDNIVDANRKPKSDVLVPMFEPLIYSVGRIRPTDDYREFVDQCKLMTPFLIGFLSCPEGFSSKPYRDGRGIPTIGYGSTRTPTGRVSMRTPSVSKEVAYEYSRWHIEDYETDFIIYCYCVAFDRDLSTGEYFGLASFIYNGGANMFEPNSDKKSNRIRNERWAQMRNLYREQGTITRDQVKACFEKFPIVSEGSVCAAWRSGAPVDEIGNNMTNYLSGGRGLIWRRWIEACVLTGRIAPIDLMDCPVGGIYDFQKYMRHVHHAELIDKDTHTVNYDAADIFLEWLNNRQYWDSRHRRLYFAPDNEKTIRDILPPDIVAQCEDTKSMTPLLNGGRISSFNVATIGLEKLSRAAEDARRRAMDKTQNTGNEI